MGDTGRDPDSEPHIQLRQIAAERNGDHWAIAWAVKNSGSHPLRIVTVRQPHGQFKAGEMSFDPAYDLKPGQETQFENSVRCDEPPGLITENAFVIFRVIWSGEPWRIFARVRVVIDPDGKPQAVTESITTQKVGFSKTLP